MVLRFPHSSEHVVGTDRPSELTQEAGPRLRLADNGTVFYGLAPSGRRGVPKLWDAQGRKGRGSVCEGNRREGRRQTQTAAVTAPAGARHRR